MSGASASIATTDANAIQTQRPERTRPGRFLLRVTDADQNGMTMS